MLNLKNKREENKKILINISGVKNFITFEYTVLFKFSEPYINRFSVIPAL